MSMTTSLKHFIRVGAHNEMSAVAVAMKHCDGLILSQPLVHMTSVGPKLQQYNKPFLVDPETYRYFFERRKHYKNFKRGQIRAWLKSMADVMPEEIQSSFGSRRALPDNFDAEQITQFCAASMEIQLSIRGSSGEPVLPVAVMSPYFMIDVKDFGKALSFHKQVIGTMTRINESGRPTVGVLYLSRDLLLRPERLRQIVGMASELPCDGLAVWVENFDESGVDEDELVALRNFYADLSQHKFVISLYGGLAQVMMMYKGLGGVCNGVHYQTHRSGLADGGGPAHYFYVSNLRSRIRTIEASAMIGRQKFNRAAYLRQVCDCSVCEDHISHDPVGQILALEGNRGDQVSSLITHFNHNKHIEILKTTDLTASEYVDWVLASMDSLELTADESEYREVVLRWLSSILDYRKNEDIA